MRGGRLLTEKSPTTLYEEYKTTSLQEIVLNLCHKDETSEDNVGRQRSKSSGNILHIESIKRLSLSKRKYSVQEDNGVNNVGGGGNHPTNLKKSPSFFSDLRNSLKRIRSLTTKNACVMLRNIM